MCTSVGIHLIMTEIIKYMIVDIALLPIYVHVGRPTIVFV